MSSAANARRLANEMRTLTAVAKALATRLSLPDLLQAVMEQIAQALEPTAFGVVLLWDPSEGVFHPQASCGESFRDPWALRSMALLEGESITGKVFRQGTARLLATSEQVRAMMADMRAPNRLALSRAFGEDILPSSVVAAPLIAGGQKFGVLLLGSLYGQAVFSEENLPFVRSLADLLALAIDRDRLEFERAANREARLADQLRAEALATLSHELRTPLAAIKGYSTALLLDEVDWPEQKRVDFLKLIDEECENLQIMITDILDSALIDVGRLDLEIQPVRIEILAREVADELQQRTEAHQLVVDFQEGFPIVAADPRRIKQVLRNILDNSIKYSPEGGLVMIRGEVRPKDVVVSISDQGVGISPEDLIPLFEKFFRVKAATGYHVPGTGLGLPVARAIVEEHGGRIWAESSVGEGTKLAFSLPLAPLEEASAQPEDRATAESGPQYDG